MYLVKTVIPETTTYSVQLKNVILRWRKCSLRKKYSRRIIILRAWLYHLVYSRSINLS